jgi:hypothetical protein
MIFESGSFGNVPIFMTTHLTCHSRNVHYTFVLLLLVLVFVLVLVRIYFQDCFEIEKRSWNHRMAIALLGHY